MHDTVCYVTPTDFAAEEIACWEQALREQHDAEDQLTAARRKLHVSRILQLMPQLKALRTRADLMLAEAVKVKCAFRDYRLGQAVPTTVPGQP